jgi:hypothetical protein
LGPPKAKRIGLVAGIGALSLAVLLSPVKLCVVAVLFHVPCPGCGMTRAALSMLRGDFASAFALHPLSIVIVPFTGAVVVLHVVRYVRTGSVWSDVPVPRWIEVLAASLVLLLIGVWVARFCGFLGGPVAV